MNKTIMGLLIVLTLLVPSSALADSYQHFAGSPFNLTFKPGDTLFINNNSGKVQQLTELFNGTSIQLDSDVGNNGATQVTLTNVGQYTFMGSDGVIGYVIVQSPQLIPSPTDQIITLTPKLTNQTSNNSTSPIVVLPNNSTKTNNFTAPTIPINTPVTSAPIVAPTNTTSTNPIVPVPIIQAPINQNNTALVQQIATLEAKIDSLQAQENSHYQQLNDMQNIIFGMLTKLLHLNNLQ